MKWCPLLLACLPLAALAETRPVTDWEGLTPDPALAWQGRPAWAWTDPVQVTSVTAKDAPTDWTPYQSLHLTVHCAAPTPSTITLVLASEDRASEGSDYFAFTFRTDYTAGGLSACRSAC